MVITVVYGRPADRRRTSYVAKKLTEECLFLQVDDTGDGVIVEMTSNLLELSLHGLGIKITQY